MPAREPRSARASEPWWISSTEILVTRRAAWFEGGTARQAGTLSMLRPLRRPSALLYTLPDGDLKDRLIVDLPVPRRRPSIWWRTRVQPAGMSTCSGAGRLMAARLMPMRHARSDDRTGGGGGCARRRSAPRRGTSTGRQSVAVVPVGVPLLGWLATDCPDRRERIAVRSKRLEGRSQAGGEEAREGA